MSFARFDCSARTDASFRHRHQIEHHKTMSPIELLPIDMVSDFPTSDPLHLLELGIMKKCLIRWKDGSKFYKSHFSQTDKEKFNEMLSRANDEKPSEIHRSIRLLNCLSDWKGSEYRTFLLYVSIVVLKEFLRQDEYEHFLKFYCAVTICSSDIYRKHVMRRNENILSLSQCLFNDYIEQYIEIYGSHSISSNVHNLAHVTDDVIRFGNLNNISTYPYENRLGMLKNKLKKCNKPLEQIARRIAEIKLIIESESCSASKISNGSFPKLKDPQLSVGSNLNSFSTIIFENNYRLSTKKFGDKWFLIKDTAGTSIIEMTRVSRTQSSRILVFGKAILEKRNFFENPFSSSNINIYISNGKKNEELSYPLEVIACKMVCLTYQREFIFIPLVHTLSNQSLY